MGNPEIPGQNLNSPFVHENIDILKEDILIKLDSSFVYADYHVKYSILSSKQGIKIPFIFYAPTYENGFTLFINNNAVELKTIPEDFNLDTELAQSDLNRFFTGVFPEIESAELVKIPLDSSGYIFEPIQEFIYFEMDIPEGESTIELSYKARAWSNNSGYLEDRNFRYALFPAKQWRSFNTLNVTLDASAFDGEIVTNMGSPKEGDLTTIAGWSFDTLPLHEIQIHYKPEISMLGKFFMKVDPFLISIFLLLAYSVLLVFLVKKYRKHYTRPKLSWVGIVGVLLLPFIFVGSILGLNYLFKLSLEGHASHHLGYGYIMAIVILFIPLLILTLIYGVALNIYDQKLRKSYKSKGTDRP